MLLLLLLNLYNWFKSDVYLQAANSLYKTIISMREMDGMIMYSPGLECNYVDAVGMYVPFLMEYYSVTKDSFALDLISALIISMNSSTLNVPT